MSISTDIEKLNSMSDFSAGLYFQTKLTKHLQNADISRLRDYMTFVIIRFPKVESCPIDSTLLKKCLDLVKTKYILNQKYTNTSNVFIKK